MYFYYNMFDINICFRRVITKAGQKDLDKIAGSIGL